VFLAKRILSRPHFPFLIDWFIMKIGEKLRRSQAISTDDGNVSQGKKNFHLFDLGQTQIDLLILY
jgi:hypothetical protein